jgi:hypothetical protein
MVELKEVGTLTAEMMLAEMLARIEMKALPEACHASSFARPYRSFCMAQESEEGTALDVFSLGKPLVPGSSVKAFEPSTELVDTWEFCDVISMSL